MRDARKTTEQKKKIQIYKNDPKRFIFWGKLYNVHFLYYRTKTILFFKLKHLCVFIMHYLDAQDTKSNPASNELRFPIYKKLISFFFN